MSSTRDQIPPRRKRPRTEAGSSFDDSSEPRPSKRQKPSIKLHSAEFYDSLSKVWLTRRALKEFERRTSQVSRPQRPASTRRQIDREDTWKKQIQRFARHGGPELRDLRGYPAPRDVDLARTMSTSSRSRRTQSIRPTSNSASRTSDRRSSAYDDDFEQHLIDHNIYPEGYDYPDGRQTPEPGNLEGFHQRLQQPRPSLSPSRFPDSSFRGFKRKNGRVVDEGEVMRDVVPVICGNATIPNKQNLLFTRLNPIANDTTVDAKPDFYDGARLEDIDKQIRDDLGPFIIPTGHRTAPVAPNFFLEAKAPKGGADVAKRQACYDGAIGARAMHSLQSYKQEPIYDGNAYTITSTYHAGTGTLQMYTTQLAQSAGSTPEYHMTQVKGWVLTSDPDSFRQGATALRNARDWAQEQRDGFISAANAEPSLELSDHDDLRETTELQHTEVSESSAANREEFINPHWPSSESSGFNDPSETTATHPAEESETSPDELALITYSTPTASNKRRNRRSQQTISKASRHSDVKSRRRRRSNR